MMADNLPALAGKQSMISREEFSAVERRLQTEFAATTLAARAKAEVEARFVMAERHPRDMDDVRVRVLAECKRGSFAKAARYKIPNRGEGFTIRFAEAVIQQMGNFYCPANVLYEDDERRIIQAQAIDLERNVTWERTITIPTTVERKDGAGREILRRRQKADGSIINVVVATEDELLVKEGSAISKAQRTNALRIVPTYLLEEAKNQILATIQARVDKDTDAARKALADAFAAIKVMPADLKEFLGCELSQVAPKELVDLRQVYTAIKEGQTTWRELMADKRGAGEEPEEKPDLKQKLKGKQEASLKEQAEAARARRAEELAKLEVLTAWPDSGDYKPGDCINVKGQLWMRALEGSTSEWEKVTA